MCYIQAAGSCYYAVVLSEGDEPRIVTGCILTTPKLVIRVDQVSGYRQAQLHPDTENWAAPFTWSVRPTPEFLPALP